MIEFIFRVENRNFFQIQTGVEGRMGCRQVKFLSNPPVLFELNTGLSILNIPKTREVGVYLIDGKI